MKELLTMNKKALQGAHFIKGYDFEKPFIFVKGEGRFTVNQIKKQVEAQTSGRLPKGGILFIKRNRGNGWSDDELYLTYIDDNFFRVRPYESHGDTKAYRFNLDLFFSVGDLEETRKKYTEKWYFLSQFPEYIGEAKKEKEFDFNSRFKAIEKTRAWTDGKGRGGFSSGKFQQGNETREIRGDYYSYEGIYNPLDKSGYWIKTYQVKQSQKLRQYKKQKRAEEAKKYDYSAESEKWERKTKELVKKCREMLNGNNYSVVCNNAYLIIGLLSNIQRNRKQTAEKSYSSIDEIKRTFERIEKYYTKLETAINAN